ncbi:Inositol-trisphosphate 3-kinase B [Melipona quadrifasciata]|uniref:Kinase n=1 Tax=Melipona quadrifasciata TaxID=166423 RepID=A0A0M8ZWM8_9HYME|nr:Inositol-trisphosphate 3-kinase B [Melipona quadrifasciata]
MHQILCYSTLHTIHLTDYLWEVGQVARFRSIRVLRIFETKNVELSISKNFTNQSTQQEKRLISVDSSKSKEEFQLVKTYDRITVPKIVICSKSALEDCVEAEECDRRSLTQRRMTRSRSRRHSRRFSSSIVEHRRSLSSSRSPSPSCLSSRSQDQPHNEERPKNDPPQDSERRKCNQLGFETELGDEKMNDCIVERLKNSFIGCKGEERDSLKLEETGVSVTNDLEIDLEHKRSSRCNKCQSNKGDETCLENCSGYQQYLRLLEVPQVNLEWGESSGDDLSSEWDSDHADKSNERKSPKSSGWRKLRNIVHWTPFFQTYKKQRYPWVQLAGHQGNFRAGPTPGTILKKLCPQEEACFRLLMNDILRPYVPEFKGVLDVNDTEEVSSYLQLQDLLGDFEHPCVMDCKVGVRTYLESELAKAKERPKYFSCLFNIQYDLVTFCAVTKRHVRENDTGGSVSTKRRGTPGARSHETKVTEALRRFVEGYPHAVPKYIQRLKAIRATLKASPFFASHEVVGSSLLFVHDAKNAGIWMIDFAKTLPLPQHLPRICHDAEWKVGNHEDGYLIGVNNLIDIFQDIWNSEGTKLWALVFTTATGFPPMFVAFFAGTFAVICGFTSMVVAMSFSTVIVLIEVEEVGRDVTGTVVPDIEITEVVGVLIVVTMFVITADQSIRTLCFDRILRVVILFIVFFARTVGLTAACAMLFSAVISTVGRSAASTDAAATTITSGSARRCIILVFFSPTVTTS